LRVSAVDSDGKPVERTSPWSTNLARSGVGFAFEEVGRVVLAGIDGDEAVVRRPPPPPGRYPRRVHRRRLLPAERRREVVRGETTDVAVTLLRR
jgi:hypothetical protein